MTRAKKPRAVNQGQLWTPDEDLRLVRAMSRAGWLATSNMRLHGRTRGAVIARMTRIGLTARGRSKVAMAADVMLAFDCPAAAATSFLRRHPEAYKVGYLWHLPQAALKAEVERRAREVHASAPLYYLSAVQAAAILGVKDKSVFKIMPESARRVKVLVPRTNHWSWVYHEADVYAYRDSRRRAA